MRFIRSAATTLTLAGAATLAAAAVPAFTQPAFAQGPVIDVTPSTAAPGASVTFAITCDTAVAGESATLTGTTLGLPEQIPMDPGTHAGEFVTVVQLPTSISPGGYSPSIDCSDGTSGTASLTVNPAPIPTGAPVTGDGTTSSATGGPFTTAGLALLAVGGLAVGAGVIRKRRRAGSRS
jgi:hypothetical protein